MRKLALTLFYLVFAFQSETGYSGDGMGNGGGLAEANIALVYSQLASYLSICLKMTTCSLNEAEAQLLSEVGQAMAVEIAAHKPLFKSEIKEPGFFRTQQGTIAVYRTGTSIGDPVYFNLDLIYRKDPLRGVQSITVAEATQIVFAAFAHHHAGLLDDDHVSALALRLKDMVAGQARTFYLNNVVAPGAGFQVLPDGEYFPQLLINDSEDLFDVTASLKTALMTEMRKFSIAVFTSPVGIGFYWDSCFFASHICLATVSYKVKGEGRMIECKQKYVTSFKHDISDAETRFNPKDSYVEKTICTLP